MPSTVLGKDHGSNDDLSIAWRTKTRESANYMWPHDRAHYLLLVNQVRLSGTGNILTAAQKVVWVSQVSKNVDEQGHFGQDKGRTLILAHWEIGGNSLYLQHKIQQYDSSVFKLELFGSKSLSSHLVFRRHFIYISCSRFYSIS